MTLTMNLDLEPSHELLAIPVRLPCRRSGASRAGLARTRRAVPRCTNRDTKLPIPRQHYPRSIGGVRFSVKLSGA